MRVFSILLVFVLVYPVMMAQKKDAYVLYTSSGKLTSYANLLKKSKDADIVFFGEYHDNPIAHWLELELANELYATHGQNLILGFEMFEQDQQDLLTQFIDTAINAKGFEDSCRLWTNYSTDYKPILEFARLNQIDCIASNIPRKYASLLFRKGRPALDSLTEREKSFICPLDFVVDSTLSQYASLKDMEQHMGGKHMMEAQAIKDATMAYFILKNLSSNDKMLHFNGSYHSDFHQGIIWYIEQTSPEKKIFSVSTVTQQNLNKLEKENYGKADIILCVPENMTRTH